MFKSIFSHGRQGNLVDNMVGMLEKYANNLEELVEERTQQLAAEKQKTDELLYKMLPKYVIPLKICINN